MESGAVGIAIIVTGLLAVIGLTVWRAFWTDDRFRPSAENGWLNENHSAREATGSFSEHTRSSGTSTAPPGYTGEC